MPAATEPKRRPRTATWTKVAIGTLVLLLTLAVIWDGCATTPPITDSDGRPLPGSIASLETVRIGGMDQWLLIRGWDVTGPILLWLHGRPGASEMPVVPHFNGALEQHFVVAHWDQRGAGKSNPRDFDKRTMTFERFVQDGHELTRYLKERFGKEKIYLLGHSWGSHLGLVLAHRYPEDYHAYIGVSQHVDATRSHGVAHDWLAQRIQEEGNADDLERLRALGDPPYRDHETFVRFIHLVSAYGGDLDVPMAKMIWLALSAPHYTFGDLLAWFRGANRGSGLMWDEPVYQHFDAFDAVPRLEVPAYFFNGKNDYNTPLAVTRAYVEALEAPSGKELVVFEQSAHTPFMAEPEAFNRALVRVKQETWQPRDRTAYDVMAARYPCREESYDTMKPLYHHALGERPCMSCLVSGYTYP